MMNGLCYLVLLEDRDFLLFWYGWSRLVSVHGECWMGGGSYTGLEVELGEELRHGRRDCGAADGDMQEPSMKDCDDTGVGCVETSLSPGQMIPEESCDD